jgi:hypothetical protein
MKRSTEKLGERVVRLEGEKARERKRIFKQVWFELTEQERQAAGVALDSFMRTPAKTESEAEKWYNSIPPEQHAAIEKLLGRIAELSEGTT